MNNENQQLQQKSRKCRRSVDFEGVRAYKAGHVREGWSRLAAARLFLFELQKRAHQEGPHSAVIK
jgi:hypothetical protein